MQSIQGKQRWTVSAVISSVVFLILLATAAVVSTGCSNASGGQPAFGDMSAGKGSVAAEVNGRVIYEDDVTNVATTTYGSYLAPTEEGATAPSTAEIRSMVVDSLVNSALIQQIAERESIDVSAEMEKQGIEKTLGSYTSMAESIVMEKLFPFVEATDEEVLEYLNNDMNFAPFEDGSLEKIVTIYEFEADNTAGAEKVQKALQDNPKANPTELMKDATASFDQWYDANSYQEDPVFHAVASLSVGGVTDVLEIQGTGMLAVAVVTDELRTPEGGFTSVDQIPETLVDWVRSSAGNMGQSNQYTQMSSLTSEERAHSTITIYPMPEGLAYEAASTEGAAGVVEETGEAVVEEAAQDDAQSGDAQAEEATSSAQ